MTDWESCYVKGEMPWNKDAPSPPLVEWVCAARPRGRTLVPGCGLGHDVVMLATSGVDAMGLDISTRAVDMARLAYPAHADRFFHGDLFAPPADWPGSFDLVVEHTCLSGMPPDLRPAYAQAVGNLLRPGGLLVGVWYVNPDMEPGEPGPPWALPVEELGAMFAEPAWEILEDYVPVPAFPGREGRERLRVLRKR